MPAPLRDAEKVFGFLDTGQVAQELKSNVTVSFFQNDSQKAQIVSREAPANVAFCLSNDISLKKSRSKGGFKANHNAAKKSKRDA